MYFDVISMALLWLRIYFSPFVKINLSIQKAISCQVQDGSLKCSVKIVLLGSYTSKIIFKILISKMILKHSFLHCRSVLKRKVILLISFCEIIVLANFPLNGVTWMVLKHGSMKDTNETSWIKVSMSSETIEAFLSSLIAILFTKFEWQSAFRVLTGSKYFMHWLKCVY